MSDDDSLRIRIHAIPTPGPWLLIDATWPVAAAGVWENGAWRSFVKTEGAVTASLFVSLESALKSAGTKPADLAGYLYATGPGSVLGLRTAAMVFGTWRATPGLAVKPVLAYDSLALSARLAKRAGLGEATVFAAARRDHWNVYSAASPVSMISDSNALAGMRGPFLRLPGRDFSPPPAPFENFDPIAALEAHPGVFDEPGLLFETDTPDAANLANQYVTWSGERHKA